MAPKQLAIGIFALAVLGFSIEEASAYYASPIGRFINRDPISYRGSQWNLYEYTNGSPLTRTDPYGLWSPFGNPPPGYGSPMPSSPGNGTPIWGEDPFWDHYEDGDGSDFVLNDDYPEYLDRLMDEPGISDWIDNTEEEATANAPVGGKCGDSIFFVTTSKYNYEFGGLSPWADGTWAGWFAQTNEFLPLGTGSLLKVTSCTLTINCHGCPPRVDTDLDCNSTVYVNDKYQDPGRPFDSIPGVDFGWPGNPYNITGEHNVNHPTW